MADYLELNIEALSKRLRLQASGFRRLAGETLDEDFQTRLLELAADYDLHAMSLERGYVPDQ